MNEKKREALLYLKARGKHLCILKRITIILKEENQMVSINQRNEILSKFDIIALEPSNEKLLLQSVQCTEIDLITFNLTQKLNFRLKWPIAKQAIANGIYFEISLRDLIKEKAQRRQFISNARKIVDGTRGKNIVLSTGSYEPMQLRGPHDIMNLSSLFGIESSKAKKAMTEYSRNVEMHGQSRKTEKNIVKVIPLSNTEKWMIPEGKEIKDAENIDSATSNKKRKREDKDF